MTEKRGHCPTPGKRVYASREAAERRRPAPSRFRGSRPLLFPYLCECGRWHLGTVRDPQGPRRTCPTPDKVGFATEDQAERRAANLSAIKGMHLRVYLCDCGWWHLTSRELLA